MPPRVRGGRWSDTPKTQAAIDGGRLVSSGYRSIARPGRWPGRIGSERRLERNLRVSVSPS